MSLPAFQQQLLQALANGRTQSEIAASRGYSKHLVNYHLTFLRQQWGCRTNLQTVVEAKRRGLID